MENIIDSVGTLMILALVVYVGTMLLGVLS